VMTGRAELEWRVDDLAQQHSGRAFADAIKALADELNGDEKELLQQILVERGASFDQAIMERVDARGWFQRQWDKAGGS
jgi:CHASE3 domain sensor protein